MVDALPIRHGPLQLPSVDTLLRLISNDDASDEAIVPLAVNDVVHVASLGRVSVHEEVEAHEKGGQAKPEPARVSWKRAWRGASLPGGST